MHMKEMYLSFLLFLYTHIYMEINIVSDVDLSFTNVEELMFG